MFNEYEEAYIENTFRHGPPVELSVALANLSMMLHKYHGVAPIIIIDEYDTPIQQGHIKGFYDEIIGFMRNLFSGGLRTIST